MYENKNKFINTQIHKIQNKHYLTEYKIKVIHSIYKREEMM